MPSSTARRTSRNLLKIASLGLAGLLAGLLSGCTDTQDASTSTPYSSPYSDAYRPANSAPLPESLDAVQIPALHRPPSARRLEFGSLHTVSQSMTPNGRNRS
jgi:hypothetical protein